MFNGGCYGNDQEICINMISLILLVEFGKVIWDKLKECIVEVGIISHHTFNDLRLPFFLLENKQFTT